jgi:hypothetical protein
VPSNQFAIKDTATLCSIHTNFPIASLKPPRYIGKAMVDRLHRISNSALPLASLLALAIGPAAVAAEAHYALHAWTAKKEAAKSTAPANNQKPEDASQPKKDNSNERTFSSFFAPTSAKPSDTHSKSGGPIIAAGRTCDFEMIASAEPACTASVEKAKTLRRPSHQANAPPIA